MLLICAKQSKFAAIIFFPAGMWRSDEIVSQGPVSLLMKSIFG